MIQDLFVPVVTPFGEDGAVDIDALSAHCDWVSGQGANGVMLFGTTGEGPSLSVREKVDVARAVTVNLPSLQVIGSVTESSVVDAAACIAGFNNLPLCGTLILPPGYFKESGTDGIRAYFEHLVRLSDHAVLGYHIPSMAPPVTIDVVADLDMWGAKDSSGDMDYTLAVLAAGKGVMVGAEAVVPDAIRAGAAGTIAGMANLIPGHLASICSRTRAGDMETAYRLRDEVTLVQQALISSAPGMEWVAALKQLAGHLQGSSLGDVRVPLVKRRDYRTPEMLALLERLSLSRPSVV